MSSVALVQVPSDEDGAVRLIVPAFGMRRRVARRPGGAGGEGEGVALHGSPRIRTSAQKRKESE